MAIVLVEGFDTYNGTGGATATTVGLASRWNVLSIAGSMSSTTPYSQGQSWASTNSSGSNKVITIGVPTNSTGAFGLALLASAAPSSSLQIAGTYVGSVSSRQFGLVLNPTGTLSIVSNSITLLTTSAIVVNAWNYIEVEFTISTTGSAYVYVNGTLVGSATGINTQAQAGSTYNLFVLGETGSGGYNNTTYFDDLYLTDTASRLGEQRVVTVVPTSDSTPSQWSASGGAVAPYTMVDEALCNADVDYIFDGTIGDRAVFNMASTGLTPVTVSAVQLGTFSRKTDTGARSIQLQYVDSGGTAYSSSDIVLGASYARQLSLLQTNPATSAAWTPTEANNLKVGVKVSA